MGQCFSDHKILHSKDENMQYEQRLLFIKTTELGGKPSDTGR